MATHTVIAAEEVTKTYNHGKNTAVNKVDLHVDSGEIVAVLGSNGAGKTTLFDILLGLTTPSSGTVTVLGNKPKKTNSTGKVGAILQTGGLLPDITVHDTLRMVVATYPSTAPLREVIEQARLGPLLNRKVSKCSGGEQQRLKFALSLLGNPKIIFLDEPTAGMDPSTRLGFWKDVEKRAKDGTTIIFSTHYLEEAENYAQRIVLLDEGSVIRDAPTSELLATISETVVRAQMPESEAAKAPGVYTYKTHGDGVQFWSKDSDELTRYLLNSTSATNIRITPASLEDAVLALQERKDS